MVKITRRARFWMLAFVILFIGLLTFRSLTTINSSLSPFEFKSFVDTQSSPVTTWEKVFDMFAASRVNQTEIEGEAVGYIEKSKQSGKDNTKKHLLSKAKIHPEAFQKLQKSHDTLMSGIFNMRFNDYTPNTNGVIMVGGNKFSWLSYLSVLALRKTGSELPVEVFLPKTEDYLEEVDFCNSLLSLNAKCVVLEEKLGAKITQEWPEIGGYQFKSLALLTSSFQNVLLLDSDNVLIDNPDEYFDSKVFTEFGMITWPDYWPRTISPDFYNISRLSINENKRVRLGRFPIAVSDKDNVELSEDIPFHELDGTIPNLSSESGQLMINKKFHDCTLLLSTYYNLMGPGLYYKMFSLGELGEGDKDTFAAAASVCKEPFYQVKSFIKTFGYFDDQGSYHGVSMGQKNPAKDHENFERYLQPYISSPENQKKSFEQQKPELDKIVDDHFHVDAVPVFALHCNIPKLDPVNLLLSRTDLYDPKEKKIKYEFFGGYKYADPTQPDKKLDFEYEIWKTIDQGLCRNSVDFKFFRDQDVDLRHVCQLIDNQVKGLKQTRNLE